MGKRGGTICCGSRQGRVYSTTLPILQSFSGHALVRNDNAPHGMDRAGRGRFRAVAGEIAYAISFNTWRAITMCWISEVPS